MKTVYIITTRKYPLNSELFREIICERDYISESERTYFRCSDTPNYTSWNENTPLPIKKRTISDYIIYVAPCMTNKPKEHNYIEKLISTIKEKDLCGEQCNITLIAHDNDLGYEKPSFYRRNEVKPGCGSKGRIMCYDESLYAFFAFSHLNTRNKLIMRPLGELSYSYDIYVEFITKLEDSTETLQNACEKLYDFLTNIDKYEIERL